MVAWMGNPLSGALVDLWKIRMEMGVLIWMPSVDKHLEDWISETHGRMLVGDLVGPPP